MDWCDVTSSPTARVSWWSCGGRTHRKGGGRGPPWLMVAPTTSSSSLLMGQSLAIITVNGPVSGNYQSEWVSPCNYKSEWVSPWQLSQ